jgi:hypothetical protein
MNAAEVESVKTKITNVAVIKKSKFTPSQSNERDT